MNFDRVAPFYRFLETLVFRGQLQEARVVFNREIASPARVLIVGEGNGRFLAEFVRAHPHAVIDCIDASAAMLRRAQGRGNFPQVNFLHASLQQVVLERAAYDLIVTHFFLDCFEEKSLGDLIEKLTRAAAKSAQWIIADFCLPRRGWRRARARLLIASMYFFFRVAAGIETRCLIDYAPFLRRNGFSLTKEKTAPNEMIRTQLWSRSDMLTNGVHNMSEDF